MTPRPTVAGIVLLLTLAATTLPAAETASVLVSTAPVQKGRLTATVTSYGTVAVDARRTVTFSFPRPGRVSRMSVSAGQVVRKGEPLVTFATDPAAVEGFRQATAALNFARDELKRTVTMAAQGLATQSQLAAARKALSDAETTVAGQRRLGMARSSERVTAPFAGIVSAVNVKEGDLLAAGAPVLQLSRRGSLMAVLGVEPEESGRLRPGMAVRLTPVFDRQQSLAGSVREIHGAVDPQTRLVDVLVDISGAGSDRLIPGSRLKGEIATGSSSGWLVPRSAILRDDRGDYLYQVDRGRARLVRVTTGVERDDLIEVKGTLDPRLKVVGVGNYELSDGMAVREEKR